MSKNLGFIISVIFGIVCFSAGTYYSWLNMEERYIQYTDKWEKINSDVEQFVEVSNPKTIQFYVSELRKILDDMTRLSKIIEKGQEAINGIMEVAGETASPRAYEVAGQLIKSVADTTDKLADLHKKVKDIEADNPKTQNTVTNNALFVGSTSELSKMLKDGLLNNNSSE